MTFRRMLTPYDKEFGQFLLAAVKKRSILTPCGNFLLVEPEQIDPFRHVAGYKNGAS